MDLPPAPTPPVNQSGMASNADRTANLLNLLKFSGASGSAGSPQQQTQQPRQNDLQQTPQQSPSQQQQRRQSGFSQTQFSSPPTRIHQPAPAGADPSGLLAAMMQGAAHDGEQHRQIALPKQATAQAANPFSKGPPSEDTQSYLLNLLNRPKPSQTDQPFSTGASGAAGAGSKSLEMTTDTTRFLPQYQNAHQSPSVFQRQPQHLDQQQQASSVPYAIMHQSQPHSHLQNQHQESPADMSALYQQLVGRLVQSSPQPQPSPTANLSGPLQILKKEQDSPRGSQPLSHGHAASQQTPLTSPSGRKHHADHGASFDSHHSLRHSTGQPPQPEHDSFAADHVKETVADAVQDLASQADRDAQEALDRAEVQLGAANATDTVTRAQSSDQESPRDESSIPAVNVIERQIVQSIKKGHEIVPAYKSLEPAVTNDTSDSGGNAAGEHSQEVADSWESADQEEIVVIEEKEAPPVRVYNFPMKPWISISLQDEAGETRPKFRDESIMDIARLKKEFDQIDRNLYTASQTYMTYGMSKQGGLRVIRQDDGKDAKVFTDTKDRIFNVTMSVTPSDHDGIHREAIIGTGTSGTVYWVQIKDGEKDHIEDAHLEQYGFALPPMATHDGDAPGGVLKTRARASTNHPEFFAVGRGKSIRIIWPAFILRNKLFRTGHDRVVDTEALVKRCCLKINTGKAGKDFSFSQDDSVIVSLDKSGRVKFWDVRPLTEAEGDSDPRSPLPARTSLEIKDPLMTLATTLEGEKAWPTSVLLLDKQRPYQKRGALRYMIVGMKQNHTLQLWDLALGKPVQEFNLPHSNESDAVCSVMYHPASGMITIGHPTRNSIYFAHLSAPKYNLKNISQAAYIQRIAAHDSLHLQPDSTAVISGVREYSFANRGNLRSLDILCNPAMEQDADEPTLFELYAMHSAGVACVLVKQCELGWSKDNKVLDAVDALKEGVVTISTLKTPQQTELTSSEQPESLSGRPIKSPPAAEAPVDDDSVQRAPDSTVLVKTKNEAKEAETSTQSPRENAQAEKPERKPRKKKGNATKDAEAGANGASGSPRSRQASKTEPGEKVISSPVVNGAATAESLDSAVNKMQTRLTGAVTDILDLSLKNLQSKIDDRARLRDEYFNKQQIKLLDMVSEVLNENTQKVLESLIHDQFTELVIPAIGERATKAVSDVVQNKLQPNVTSAIQKEIQNDLPQAVSRALRSADFVTAISERVGNSVGATLQQELPATLIRHLTPSLHSLATQSAQQAVAEAHKEHLEKLNQMSNQHAANDSKVDRLLSHVTNLTDMMSAMASSQASLQAELLKLKHQAVHELPGAPGVLGQAREAGLGLGVPEPQGYSGNGRPAGANRHSSHASFQSSQLTGHQQHQQYLASPEYVRSGQHLSTPHGSAPQTDVASTSKISGVAGAFADQVNKTDAEAEQDILRRIQVIEQAINEGRLQDAMIQWIQSGKEKEIFHRCLSLLHPSRFENLPPLVLLVVIATIAKDLRLTSRVKQEIDWIEMAVRSFANSMSKPVSLDHS